MRLILEKIRYEEFARRVLMSYHTRDRKHIHWDNIHTWNIMLNLFLSYLYSWHVYKSRSESGSM